MTGGSRVTALIAAAGAGTRLGSGPKAALLLGGRTLLEHSLEALNGLVDETFVAVPAEHLPALQVRHPRVTFLAGGESRQESVRRLVNAAPPGLVLVHDVARPFLETAVVNRVLAAAREHGAASAALAVTDTVVRLADGGYGEAVDRGALRAIQTPQAFDRDLLADAHAAALSGGVSATDDAGLVRARGHRVELVNGSRLLLKITEPGDLLLAELLYTRWVGAPAKPS